MVGSRLKQISQHNHKISDEIYHCYTNNSSVPDELLLGPSSEDLEDQNGSGSSPSPMMRSFESGGEEAEFDSSTGILGDLEGHEDADHRLGKRIPASMSALAGTLCGSYVKDLAGDLDCEAYAVTLCVCVFR